MELNILPIEASIQSFDGLLHTDDVTELAY